MKELLRRHPDILRVDEMSVPDEYADRVRLMDLRYRSDDCEVEGFVCVPARTEGILPAVIFNRGGNREYGALQGEKLCGLAALGYAVFASQYRGNCGGTGREEFGGSDVNDVIRLIDIALDLPSVNKNGVYMFGRSRGGMMTYLACARDARIRAAAVAAGLSDCFIMYDRFDGQLMEYDMREDFNELVGGPPTEMPEEYVKRSAVCWAERILPPMLICQGSDDWRVIPGQAYEMERALTAAGKEHMLTIYPGADHSLKGTSLLDDVHAWFERYPL